MPEKFLGNQPLIIISEETREFSFVISKEYFFCSVEATEYGALEILIALQWRVSNFEQLHIKVKKHRCYTSQEISKQ